jgi:hypothetical protein
MANLNPPNSLSLSRDERSKIIPEPAAVQADTVTYLSNESVESILPSTYIGHMSDYDRYEAIRRDMWEKHRWSISTFLRQMVTAEPKKPYGWSIKTRVKKLSEAIAQKEVIEPLVRYSSDALISETIISCLANRIRVEIGSSDIGLRSFNPETPVHELDITRIYKRIQEAAPVLCKLLFALIEPKYPSQRDRDKASQGPITIITASIAYASAPKTFDNFPVLLGVHLHSIGVKRRTLSLLAGLGLIPSYQTIMRRRAKLAEIGKVFLS